jgi:hypothetical protein
VASLNFFKDKKLVAQQFSVPMKWGYRLLLYFLLAVGGLRAQPAPPAVTGGEVALVAPAASVPLAGPFTLAFRLRGAALGSHSAFPEIEGFRKAGLITTTTTRLLPGGQRSTELTVAQRYFPYTEGDYVIPAFTLTVNGQELRSKGGRVRVGAGPPLDTSGVPPGAAVGSLDQLLGPPKPKYFYEPPDAGALELAADRSQVYVGQGVRVDLYFYLKPADQALLNFYDFNNQLTELLRQLRQPTTWEVAAPDPSVLPDTVRRGGEVFLRFRLAGRTYYPLTKEALQFPALQLTLTKFKLLKKPQPGDNERLAMYKTYTAPALRVAVRPLPPPGVAAVGDYVLHEGISGTRFRTGEAFTYTFGVEGTGNAAALAPPPLRSRAGLAVYGPDVREERLPYGRFRKNFRYRLVPQRPGSLAFDSLLALPFFNPLTARYDTLRPELRIEVSGLARATATASPTDDPFYGPALARADSQLQPLDVYRQVGRYAGVLLAVLLGVAAVGWWRAR